jgi:hypothetical protein
MFKKIWVSLLSLFSFACTDNGMNYYKDNKHMPQLIFQEYLNGKIKGTGIIENINGKLTKSFEFEADAKWQGDHGELNEKMYYNDGKVDARVWKFIKITDNKYEAYSKDVIGKAEIDIAGNAMHWRYKMKIPVAGKLYTINFDDWMFLLPNGKLMNRNYFKKFGITVGQLSLLMHKDIN